MVTTTFVMVSEMVTACIVITAVVLFLSVTRLVMTVIFVFMMSVRVVSNCIEHADCGVHASVFVLRFMAGITFLMVHAVAVLAYSVVFIDYD
jgi:hypothetical protein